MLSLLVSTIVFFVASHFIRRYLIDLGLPKTMMRGLVVFVLALAISYAVAFIIDKLSAWLG